MKGNKKYMKAQAKKAEDEEMDEGAEAEDEEMEGSAKSGCGKKDMSMSKSDALTETDLQKSLDRLQAFAEDADMTTKRQALLDKARAGKLEKSERDELFELLGGEQKTPTLGEEISKSMDDNETLQKALDVSDYLQEQHNELCKSLTTLGDRLESSDHRQHEFNLLLAKAVVDTGQLVKSLAEQVEAMGATPARGPKTVMRKSEAPTQALQKSFAGAPESTLSKAQILGAMDELLRKGEHVNAAGEDWLVAISKFEQSNSIAPAVLEQVQAHLAH